MSVRVVANRYEIEDEIGRGGMAVVYRARDIRLNRFIALKLLHPFLANKPESAARFLREAEAIAKLHHPNIVEVFDTGQDEETGSHYIVMELVEGPTLSQFVQQHATVIPEVAVAMACSICDAIGQAHKANIIHRDIKPENIMFSNAGILKLMDFGIARILDADRMTASGSLIGSPAHMSPEIIEGHPYSFTCDIFSLGTVLYFTLTSQLPFNGSTTMAVFKNILENNYPPPSRQNLTVSKKIDRIVAKCLQTSPSDRYQSADELNQALIEQLAKVHFENYTEILAAYYKDPDAFNQKHIPLVKECLNASALAAVKERRIPSALENLNAILNYDPDDQQAIALLQKLRNGSLVKKRSIICGSVLLGIAAIVLLVILVPWASLFENNTSESENAPSSDSKIPEIAQAGLANATKSNQAPLNKTDKTDKTDKTESAARIENNPPFIAQNTPQTTPTDQANIGNTNAQIEQSVDTPKPAQPDDSTAPAQPDDSTEPDQISDDAQDDAHAQKKQPDKKTKITDEKSAGEKTADKKNEHKTADNEKPDNSALYPANTTTDLPEIPVAPVPILITQPVFPPDSYAFIAGKRYNANANGDISLNLAPGAYTMTVTCKTRCVPQKTSLRVTSDMNTTQEIITLAWADATVTVNAQSSSAYFVAVTLDDQNRFTKQIDYLIAGKPKSYNGFNPLGNKPIRLEVFAIDKSKPLQGMTREILEKEKTASTRIELLPGDNRTVTF